MRLQKRLGIFLLLSIFLFLGSCTKQATQRKNEEKAPTTEERLEKETSSEKTVLKMGAVVDFKNNPEAATLVAEQLILLSPSKEVLPRMAKSWDVNEQYTEFTFHLPEDLKFNNGDPVTLEDFDRSLRVIGKKEYVSFADKIKNISMPDKTTLKIELKEPQLYLLPELTKIGIFKASEIDDEGNIREYIGTGAYVLDAYSANVSAHLVKNPYFRNKDQYEVDEIDWLVLPDGEARRLALLSGQVDVIGISEHWPSISFADAGELKKNENFSFTQQNTEWYSIVKGIIINWKTGPLQDVPLRRALMYAVNREELNETLFFGQAQPCGHLFNPKFDDGPKGYPAFHYDLKKAKDLLKEGGYEEKDGKLLKEGQPVKLRFIIGTKPEAADLAIFLKNSFQELGIDTEIETFEGKLITEELEKGAFDLFISAGLFEPMVTSIKFSGIGNEFSKSGLGFGVNDAAIAAGQGILDAKNMEELSQYADAYWKEQYKECPMIPLYSSGRFAFFNKNWEGFYFTGYGDIELSKVRRVHE